MVQSSIKKADLNCLKAKSWQALTTTYYLFGERLARHERSEVGGANDGPKSPAGAAGAWRGSARRKTDAWPRVGEAGAA